MYRRRAEMVWLKEMAGKEKTNFKTHYKLTLQIRP